MPYKSRAQAAYFNIHRKEMEAQGVDVSEWNCASKGKHLPKYAAIGGALRLAKKYADAGRVPLPKPDPRESRALERNERETMDDWYNFVGSLPQETQRHLGMESLKRQMLWKLGVDATGGPYNDTPTDQQHWRDVLSGAPGSWARDNIIQQSPPDTGFVDSPYLPQEPPIEITRSANLASGGVAGDEGESWEPPPEPYEANYPQDTTSQIVSKIKPPQRQLYPLEQGQQGVTQTPPPTTIERIAQKIYGEAPPGAQPRQQLAERLMGTTGIGERHIAPADFIPGIGQALDVQEAGQQGNLQQAALSVLPGAKIPGSIVESALAGKLAAKVGGNHYDIDPKYFPLFKAENKHTTGTSPGDFYTAPTGERFYIKNTPTLDHAYNEKLAAELYREAGVPAADVFVTQRNGKPAIASKVIEGDELNKIPDKNEVKDLHAHFPADVWLGNYDSIGTGMNNIIVDSDNKAWRIDTGGALRYRAQGKPKATDAPGKGPYWGPIVTEHDTMRDPNINPYASEIFGGSDLWQKETAQKVADVPADRISDLVNKYGPSSMQAKAKMKADLLDRQKQIADIWGLNKEPPGHTPPTGSTAEEIESPLGEQGHPHVEWQDQLADEQAKYTQADLDAIREVEKPKKKMSDKIPIMSLNKTHSADQLVEALAPYHKDEIPIGPKLTAKQHGKLGDLLEKQSNDAIAKALTGKSTIEASNILSWVSPDKATNIYNKLGGSGSKSVSAIPKWEDINASTPLHTIMQAIKGALPTYAEVPYNASLKIPEILSHFTVNDILHNMNQFKLHEQDKIKQWLSPSTKSKVKNLEMINQQALADHIKQEFFDALKPMDWVSYKHPSAKKFDASELTKTLPELREMGFNPNIKILKGGHMYSYPTEIMDPKIKASEKAFFAAHSSAVAHSYGSNIIPYIARAPKAYKIDWSGLTGQGNYSGHYMNKLINAAHQKGADLIVIHNIHDLGGMNQTQYAFLNTAGLRAPHAKFDPNHLHLRYPLAGLVGGGLFAYDQARADKENGMNRGGAPKKKAGGGGTDTWMMHQASRNLHYEGMIRSPVPGRTDKLPMNVAAGSYVLPADIPSALGQDNSMAGGAILKRMFSSGPYGMPAMRGSGRTNMPHMSMRPPRMPKGMFAEGGADDSEDGNVPIVAAGGEFVIHPDVVKDIGHGSIKAGHKVLDKFVLTVRKEHIKTLKGLKPPKK